MPMGETAGLVQLFSLVDGRAVSDSVIPALKDGKLHQWLKSCLAVNPAGVEG